MRFISGAIVWRISGVFSPFDIAEAYMLCFFSAERRKSRGINFFRCVRPDTEMKLYSGVARRRKIADKQIVVWRTNECRINNGGGMKFHFATSPSVEMCIFRRVLGKCTVSCLVEIKRVFYPNDATFVCCNKTFLMSSIHVVII